MLLGLVWHFRHPQFVVAPFSPLAAIIEAAMAVGLVALGLWALRTARHHVPLAFRAGVYGIALVYVFVFGVRGLQRWYASRQARAPRNYAIARLRQLAADESDSRLRRGTFSQLSSGLVVPTVAGETVQVRATNGDGWSADIVASRYHCGIEVRVDGVEGVPWCSTPAAEGDVSDPAPSITAPSFSPLATSEPPSIGGTWLQYRGDARRTGKCCDQSPSYSWRATIGSEIRSTPSVAGDLLLVGAHNSGDIVAIDRRTGSLAWRTRAPNWIHNDVVIADGLVLAGTGNSEAGEEFQAVGSAPSGLVAYDLATGRRAWTFPAQAAVMTSPVIAGDVVAFASADGRIYGVNLPSGNARWMSQMPGSVVMGSPAVAGDTMYVSADPGYVCAFVMHSGERVWCHQLSGTVLLAGHSAPTITDSLVLASAVEDTAVVSLFLHGGFFNVLRETSAFAHGNIPLHLGSQFLYGFGRADGSLRWRVDLGGGFAIHGHVSGTATVVDDQAVVISPIGRTLTRVDLRSGRTVWQSHVPNELRGPPLIVGDKVVVVDHEGLLQTFELETGALSCSGAIGIPVDRAGPVVAGRTAYLSGVNGEVRAVPVESLVACRVARH